VQHLRAVVAHRRDRLDEQVRPLRIGRVVGQVDLVKHAERRKKEVSL